MAVVRTQVYLTEDQRRRVDALASAEGVTMAEILRRALDRYLDEEMPDPASSLAATFGAAPDARLGTRDEWHRL